MLCFKKLLRPHIYLVITSHVLPFIISTCSFNKHLTLNIQNMSSLFRYLMNRINSLQLNAYAGECIEIKHQTYQQYKKLFLTIKNSFLYLKRNWVGSFRQRASLALFHDFQDGLKACDLTVLSLCNSNV